MTTLDESTATDLTLLPLPGKERATSILDAARAYHRRGRTPIPIHRVISGCCSCGNAACVAPGKHPRLSSWAEYQRKRPTLAMLESWFADDDTNIALVCGGGLAVVDFDDLTLATTLIKAGYLDGAALAATPRPGIHAYLREATPSPSGTILAGRVDLKANGGYVLACPSQNDGRPYRTLLAGRPRLVKNAREWIVECLANVGVAVPTKASTPPAASAAPVGESWMPAALEELAEGNRNDTFTRIAGRLRRGGLERDDILALLMPHASQVGFPVEELRTVVASVSRYAPSSPSPPYKGETATPPGPLKSITVSELFKAVAASPTEMWDVAPLIARGTATTLSGLAGANKTWLLLDLSIEMARGGKWMGQFQCAQGTVLYIDEESGQRLLEQRLRKLLRGKGLDEKAVGDLIRLIVKVQVNLSNPASVESLRLTLAAIKPRLVIVDSLRRVNDAEENSATEMARVSKVIQALMTASDSSFLFADHQRKPLPYGEADTRGSGEKAAAQDQVIFVKKKGGRGDVAIVEQKKCRYDQELAPFEVRIEKVDDDTTTVQWLGAVTEAEEADREEKDGPVVVDTLRRLGRPTPRPALIAALRPAGIGDKRADAAFKWLVARGEITCTTAPGPTGGRRHCYSLPEWAPATLLAEGDRTGQPSAPSSPSPPLIAGNGDDAASEKAPPHAVSTIGEAEDVGADAKGPPSPGESSTDGGDAAAGSPAVAAPVDPQMSALPAPVTAASEANPPRRRRKLTPEATERLIDALRRDAEEQAALAPSPSTATAPITPRHADRTRRARRGPSDRGGR